MTTLEGIIKVLQELPPIEPIGLSIGVYNTRWTYCLRIPSPKLRASHIDFPQCTLEELGLKPDVTSIHIWVFYDQDVHLPSWYSCTGGYSLLRHL